MAEDQTVQINPAGSGQLIRTLQVQTVGVGSTGQQTTQSVLMQVVSIADENGIPINLDAINLNEKILETLEDIRTLLGAIVSK